MISLLKSHLTIKNVKGKSTTMKGIPVCRLIIQITHFVQNYFTSFHQLELHMKIYTKYSLLKKPNVNLVDLNFLNIFIQC